LRGEYEISHGIKAVELLRKLLNGEIKNRGRKNLVQARSFAEMLKQTIRRYYHRAVETMQVIEELIRLAKEMNEAARRGEDLGLSEDELASTMPWKPTTALWGDNRGNFTPKGVGTTEAEKRRRDGQKRA
jgi:type I site-specific restriction-modification system R (restriction) subunit